MPRRPSNVRLVDAHGNTVKLELSYAGRRDGLHVWRASSPVEVDLPQFDLRFDVLPARTCVELVTRPRARGDR